MTTPQLITLQVTFDIEQCSQRLDWQFQAQGSQASNGNASGPGVVNFNVNDTIELLVIGKSKKKKLAGLKILDAHLITRPLLHTRASNPDHAGEYPPPSPFFQSDGVPTGACVSYGNGQAAGDADEMTWKPLQTYTCHSNGRWDMSYIMTVEIQAINGTAIETQYRVFTFDPETQVGGGVGCP